MATSRLVLSHLRRSRHLPHAPLYQALHSPVPTPTPSPSSHPSHFRTRFPFPHSASFHFFHSRSSPDSILDPECNSGSYSVSDATPIPSEIVNFSSSENSILPVRVLISLLDAFHDLTGCPWWITIAFSAFALRLLLFPAFLLHMRKLKRISELFPKLPPPFPPPLSGRTYVEQILLFRTERKAIGCPSFLWFTAPIFIQMPCFLLLVTSIRTMSLSDHPGFSCGGTLWFQNLTEIPNAAIGSGSIFPILIAALHYINVQISFRNSSLGKDGGLMGFLAKCYKLYLDLLSLPLFLIGHCIPQGSLVYWVTSSSLGVIENLSLQHPTIRSKLGLPEKNAPTAAASSEESDTSEITIVDIFNKQHKVSIKDLKPKELLAVSVQLMSKEQKEQALYLLRLALSKDPDFIQALVVMGQILLQKGLIEESIESLERAISKLCLAGHPTKDEDIDLLIVASQGAGLAYVEQGKWAEGIEHLERIANLQEPDEPMTKGHYYDGLVLLASALFNKGRKAEAANYLRLAAAYNPAYNKLLEQCENDEGDFTDDLVNSRRDY